LHSKSNLIVFFVDILVNILDSVYKIAQLYINVYLVFANKIKIVQNYLTIGKDNISIALSTYKSALIVTTTLQRIVILRYFDLFLKHFKEILVTNFRKISLDKNYVQSYKIKYIAKIVYYC